MSLDSFYLGINSTDNVEITPNWGDYQKTKKQITTKTRKSNGDGSIYKFGDFDNIIIKLKNISKVDKTAINRYWGDGNQLPFWVNSGGVSDISSVMIVNPTSPIDKFSMPYYDRYDGKIILSGY